MKFKSLSVICLFLILCSCKEEAVDYRDNLVGTYKIEKTNSEITGNCLSDSSCTDVDLEQALKKESLFDDFIGDELRIKKDPSSSKLMVLNNTFWIDRNREGIISNEVSSKQIISFIGSNEIELNVLLFGSIIKKVTYSGRKL